MFRRKKDIPPPLEPSFPEAEIMLPYELCDWPRMLLGFMASSSKLDQRTKDLISYLVQSYDLELAGYITQVYGVDGIARANEITKALHAAFVSGVNGAVEASADDLFSRLEKDFNNDLEGE